MTKAWVYSYHALLERLRCKGRFLLCAQPPPVGGQEVVFFVCKPSEVVWPRISHPQRAQSQEALCWWSSDTWKEGPCPAVYQSEYFHFRKVLLSADLWRLWVHRKSIYGAFISGAVIDLGIQAPGNKERALFLLLEKNPRATLSCLPKIGQILARPVSEAMFLGTAGQCFPGKINSNISGWFHKPRTSIPLPSGWADAIKY